MLQRMLASECAKKVFVSVYADGPTRVLCFNEEKTSITSVEDVNSLVNLTYRWGQAWGRGRLGGAGLPPLWAETQFNGASVGGVGGAAWLHMFGCEPGQPLAA